MQIVNKCLTLNEFRDYVKGYYFGSLPANKLVIHHTWKPTKESWTGGQSILGLKRYYENKGWQDGPHLFIAEDGIWLFTPMRKNGIHASKLNYRSIGIEVVGNYDTEKWSDDTKTNALGAIKALMQRLDLKEKDIFFHRDISSKSCPGRAITKEWLFQELADFQIKPRIPERSEFIEQVENSSAPIPVTPPASSNEMVFVPVPDWAKEAVDFTVKHKLFKIRCAEDIRDAVKFYRFYQVIRKQQT